MACEMWIPSLFKWWTEFGLASQMSRRTTQEAVCASGQQVVGRAGAGPAVDASASARGRAMAMPQNAMR